MPPVILLCNFFIHINYIYNTYKIFVKFIILFQILITNNNEICHFVKYIFSVRYEQIENHLYGIYTLILQQKFRMMSYFYY
jgi:hypothetical protein